MGKMALALALASLLALWGVTAALAAPGNGNSCAHARSNIIFNACQ